MARKMFGELGLYRGPSGLLRGDVLHAIGYAYEPLRLRLCENGPVANYRDADLHWLSEIEPAIAKISELITRVYETRTGRPFPSANISIAGFQEIFDRDLERFAKL